MYTWLWFIFAVLFLILIPFAPKLVRIRILILRRIHWKWAVNVLEEHFKGWVVFVRIVLFVIAALLLYFGWTQ